MGRCDEDACHRVAQVSALLDGFVAALAAPAKAVRLAAVTLLLNCAILKG